MGGVEVDPDTAAARRAGPVRGRRGLRRHARLQPARRQLAVRPAGLRQAGRRVRGARTLDALGDAPDGVAEPTSRRRSRRRWRRWSADDGREPVHVCSRSCRTVMSDLVGIIRRKGELEESLKRLAELRERVAKVGATGGRQYNPGWHLALDLRNMLIVSECTAQGGAGARGVARRPHPRGLPGDGPGVAQGQPGLLARRRRGARSTAPAGADDARRPARRCSTATELAKYLTDEELAELRRLAGGGEQLMGAKRQFRVWRGDAAGGELEDYEVEVNEGEVVLDIIHRLQATQAPDLAVPVELQGRQVRLLLDGDQRHAAAGLHDPDVDVRRGRDRHGHAAAHLPGDPRPGHRRVVQLREGARDAGVRAAGRRGAGRVPDAAGRRRALAGVPQVHRVLPVPEHLPRRPRPRGEQAGVLRAAASSSGPPSWTCTRSTRATDRKEFAQDEQGLGYCNITKCCTEVCPEHIKITDNAIIPMKERVVDRRYDPLVWLGRKIFRRDQLDEPAPAHAVAERQGRSATSPSRTPAAAGTPDERPCRRRPPVGADGKLEVAELTLDRAGGRRRRSATTRCSRCRRSSCATSTRRTPTGDGH